MRNRIKLLIGIGVFFGLSAGAIAGLLFYNSSNPDSGLDLFGLSNLATPKDASTIEIDQAVQEAVQRHPEVLAYTIYRVSVDHVTYSSDGNLALAWLSLSDKQSGQPVPSEPGLAIVIKTSDPAASKSVWHAYVQADDNWNEQMGLVPADMMDEEARNQFTSPDQAITKAPPFTGYRLPWAKGQTKYLTGSIGHVFTYKSCPSSCLYAFDFADGTMFPITASKGGKVKSAVWNYPNGNTTSANYIVIEDESTTPVSYMLYMHLAQNSIPTELRTPGAPVVQGQFIGNADDTGYSTGHHLHFHVHTNPTSYWGNSVDIQFEDVTINGGRPRTCVEANNYPSYGGQCLANDRYTSGNGDSKPPFGGLSIPQAGQVINTPSITFSGWGQDDTAVSKLQVVANYDGIWRPIGDPQTTASFTSEVDLCKAGVPDGPLSVGLMVYDRAGNQSVEPQGQRQLTKTFACDPQPPICQPTENQVAIFINKGYQGPCQVLDIGNFADLSSFSNFGDNNLESIMVGANVTAVVFDTSGFKDRVESFISNDENLSDNLIGLDKASSIRVLKNPITPAPPVLNKPVSASSNTPTSQDSITLTWLPAVGAVEYRSELFGPAGFSASLDWNKADSWSIGSLPAGEYNWTVWDRNGETENHTSLIFVIDEASLSQATPLSVPYNADFETKAAGWVSTGFWKLGELSSGSLKTTAWFTGDTESFGSAEDLSADLTSPSINIPYEGLSLQFAYFTDTESLSIFRDQRWVQISEDGGPFKNVLQIQDSADGESWDENKTVDLTPYNGHSIRIRFHFDAIDSFYNDYFGWAVDNVRIDVNPEKLCGEIQNDGTPQTASLIEIPAKVDGQLCPLGDLDYFKFKAVKDQHISAELSFPDADKKWLPVISIVSSDGVETLAETSTSEASGAYALTYVIPEDGEYYLKIDSTDAEENQPVKSYTLKLVSDNEAPQITVITPSSEQVMTGFPFKISVEVNDGEGSGAANVEFWWHTKSWANDKWSLLGVDNDGSDGWSWEIPSTFTEPVEGAALFIRANDYAGNFQGVTIPVNPLNAAPSSHLLPLPENSTSTAVLLNWQVDVNPDNIQNFLIQYREGENDWVNLETSLARTLRQTWFIGKNDTAYQFRISAIDLNRKEEPWPDNAESVTKIEAACTPDAFDQENASDNKSAAATILEIDQTSAEHNYCGPEDQDWYKFTAESGKTYKIEAMPKSGGAASDLQIIGTDQQTILKEAKAAELDATTLLEWKAPDNGEYYIRSTSINPLIAGTSAIYTLRIEKSSSFSIPGLVCTATVIPALLYLLKIIIGLFRPKEEN